MQDGARLTPTSFIVLGLLEAEGATPYDLKARVAASIGNFWSVPHSALYAEPDRLVGGGYLTVEQEDGGLRRKRYALTEKGKAALEDWRGTPSAGLPELRDESLLKVFFGADPAQIAAAQREAHREKLAEYEQRERELAGSDSGPARTLAAGVAHEREWVRYWSKLAG